MAFSAVVGSLTEGETARSATSASWRTEKPMSCNGLRSVASSNPSRTWRPSASGSGCSHQIRASTSPVTT